MLEIVHNGRTGQVTAVFDPHCQMARVDLGLSRVG
jgi:hypothetical protein